MTEISGVVAPLAAALNDHGYTELTPVQKAVLAPELDDADAIVSAQTGSGKTVAFGIAIAKTLLGDLEQFERADAPLALVVAPTRELAMQVQRELEWLYAKTRARVASCVGGMDMRSERRALERGAHIVVGTPERLRDHIDRGSLNTSGMRAVVLDEADEMLDLGFRDDLEFILETTPEDRRTLMFSATVPRSIAHLAKKYQRDAVRITTADEKKQHVDIEYRALVVGAREQENAIINVLRYYEAKNALVFCSTRASVNHMTSRFNNRGFSVVALSGELNQNQRTHALQALRDGRARVCIATDVAARGLDLPNLELVIHADLPNNSETLLHRSGRTGRAGRKGVSALIVPQNRRKKAERLLNGARISADWAPPPSAADIVGRDEERLLSHETLTAPVSEDERALVERIIAQHGAEQAAVAFIRLSQAGQSAPEELQAVAEGDVKKPAPRKEFTDSVWISLAVGYKQNAEPRWLIPRLCEAGGITNKEIGAIKIKDEETFVQLTASSADGFFNALGPDAALEDNIKVVRLEGTPAAVNEPGGRPDRGRPDRGRSDRGARSDRGGRSDRGRADRGRSDRGGADRGGEGRDRSSRRKSRDDGPRTRKPFSAQERAGGGDEPGNRGNRKSRAKTDQQYDPTANMDADFKTESLEEFVASIKRKGGKTESGKPKSKGRGKPAGKPSGKFADKPSGKAGRKPGSKPSGKFAGKPGGKSGGKSGGGKKRGPRS